MMMVMMMSGLLFHRVILMSGSALSSWARASSPHNTSRYLPSSLPTKLSLSLWTNPYLYPLTFNPINSVPNSVRREIQIFRN